MIDKKNFDFEAFLKKYNLEYSEEMMIDLVDGLSDSMGAVVFCQTYICDKCEELEPIIFTDEIAKSFYNELLVSIEVLKKSRDKIDKNALDKVNMID